MALNVSHQQIIALAPDTASAKAGQQLAQRVIWQSLGSNGAVAWGECQGSATQPYRTQAAFDGAVLASRCSCPSRKAPCKHILGLLLLVTAAPESASMNEPPAWVTVQAVTEPAAHAEAATPAIAPAASTLRTTEREQRVASGIIDLQRWLHDLLRQGLAVAQQQPLSFWEQPAARLVDAQAPGLARLVRALPNTMASGAGWPERMLERIARIHLLLEGYARLATLPEATQADIRTAIGWNVSREEIAERPGLRDDWQIIGRRVSEEEGLRTQRTYLYGANTRRFALILDFTPAHQPLERTLLPGTLVDAELAFYPSAAPLRALVKTQFRLPQRMVQLAGNTLAGSQAAFTQAIAQQPWVEQHPWLLTAAVPVYRSSGWRLQIDGHLLPMLLRNERGWQLLALSGGHPLMLFGEWNGETLTPLSVWADGALSEVG